MDSLTLAISQGSLRRGSAAVYLDVHHPEIEEFLEIRKTSGDFNRKSLNLHHGLNITDEFMAPSEGCQGEPLSAVQAPLPEYPQRGWTRGEQGWSIVQFDVAQSGVVENVRIAQGVPGRFFDRAAVRAVEGWQFAPLSEGAHLSGCTVMFEFVLGQVRIR